METKKIYIVNHHEEDGADYEHTSWDTDYYFSTWENAYAFLCNQIMDEYKGSYMLSVVHLDTQEKTVLEKSPWGGYTCPEDDDWEPEPDYDNCSYDDPYDPHSDVYHAFYYLEYEEACEQEVEDEWMNTPHEQYEPLHEIEEDRINAMSLEELLTELTNKL